jgi:alkyldihydroxyacetonephosphate synthase
MADKSLSRVAANLDNTTWDHKWGFADTKMLIKEDRSVFMTGNRYALSGFDMPELLPFIEKTLGITIDLHNIKAECPDKPVPPPGKNERFCRAVARVFPESRYTFDPRERLLHSHGQTTAEEVYKVLYSRLERVADMVFFCESQDDAVKLVALAREHNVCLVPYGGGTSVSCALKLPVNERRMIVSIDMRRMNKIEWIDRENFRACVQAGITGSDLEAQLEREGFTSGHEPDSLELSTLGGWVATNASGMKKNRYGNIEDIVENVTMITAQGIVEQVDAMPRLAMGIQPQHLLFGSEGTLGLITKAVIKIHKLPQTKKYGSIVFPNFKRGVDCLYELRRANIIPASIRLLDNIQFRFGTVLKPRPTSKDALISKLQKFYLSSVKHFDFNEMVGATIVMEGTAEEVAYQEKNVYRIAKKYGGIPGGEHNGKRGYMLTYAIAYIRDFLAAYHITGETYETTVPWNKIHEVCDAVAQRGRELHEAYGLPGRPYISPRVTQLYHTGVCIYFTHGFSTQGVAAPDEILSKIDHILRETIMEHGGSISHHHGVGKLRKDFLPKTLSPASICLLQDVKKVSDPQNIFGIRNNVFADEK